MTRPRRRLLPATVVIAFGLAGCRNVSGLDPGDCTPSFEDGALPSGAGVQPDGLWQSSDWIAPPGETWIAYPGECRLTIPHDLTVDDVPVVPTLIQVYISFAPDGEAAGLAAGDVARIIDVTDQDVTLENATLEDFYLRLVLR